ncbi:hypothetical protein PGTUg99_012819 [Puccinia graminis f. sp. tritici]|uniref:Uncharacterized protein n=1 Tax=Puccinia graminis f. sp. tritici TaxID=56615 RepID=A0A5B0Q0H7_PUCGR|nr:hypothetical protein PGTUg99_012819 [Puccinia graminis f. sp. tritici]
MEEVAQTGQRSRRRRIGRISDHVEKTSTNLRREWPVGFQSESTGLDPYRLDSKSMLAPYIDQSIETLKFILEGYSPELLTAGIAIYLAAFWPHLYERHNLPPFRLPVAFWISTGPGLIWKLIRRCQFFKKHGIHDPLFH